MLRGHKPAEAGAPSDAPPASLLDQDSLLAFADAAFRHVLNRAPTDAEREHWAQVTAHRGHAEVLELLGAGDEGQHQRTRLATLETAVAPDAQRPFVEAAFDLVLDRAPTAHELEHWSGVAAHRGHTDVLRLLFEGDEQRHREALRTAGSERPAVSSHRPFVEAAFRLVLRRAPTGHELEHWSEVTAHAGPAQVLTLLFEGDEYVHRNGVDDRSEFYAGHFYSPVVDPEALRASGFAVDHHAPETAVQGIDFRPDAMRAFWRRNIGLIASAPFSETPDPQARYYAGNDVYSWGDACVLLAMIHETRPARIVEIGSGFSSACMLDTVDRLGLETRFTFVEPYPERLRRLLRESDEGRCAVLETGVQQADLAIFDALEANDILFIDSTHVSKAGSDVNHELFEVLPRLKSGVVVHFHDIFYPFEYPEAWIFESRRSWNEAYILRAYLTNNPAFEMLFFNHYFALKHPCEAAQAPKFVENPGGGLWLRKV